MLLKIDYEEEIKKKEEGNGEKYLLGEGGLVSLPMT